VCEREKETERKREKSSSRVKDYIANSFIPEVKSILLVGATYNSLNGDQ
jgi:hypothetical protein